MLKERTTHWTNRGKPAPNTVFELSQLPQKCWFVRYSMNFDSGMLTCVLFLFGSS